MMLMSGKLIFFLSLFIVLSCSTFIRLSPDGVKVACSSNVNASDTGMLVKQDDLLSQLASWPMFRHDNLRTGNADGTAPASNATVWTYSHPVGWIVTSPVIDDGVVIIGDEYSDISTNSYPEVHALDEATGESLWNFSFLGWPWTPVMADETVIFGTTSGSMYALKIANGAVVWEKNLGEAIESSPAIADETIYVGTLSGSVFALNQSSGDILWQRKIGYESALSPATAYNTIFLTVDNPHPKTWLCALDSATGNLKWSFNFTSFTYPRWWSGIPLTSPAVADGKVYTGAYGLYCLNATSGEVIWQNATIAVSSSPSIDNGRIFFGGAVDKPCLYALDQDTGVLVWQHEFDDSDDTIYSSPAIADGMIFFASFGGFSRPDASYVYALNETDGDMIWSYRTGDGEAMTSPAVADGRLFVTTPNYLFVFGQPVANFVWSPFVPRVGQPVTFDASSSIPSDQPIVDYSWNLGDGQTESGQTVSHTYTGPATYMVTLNVTDGKGLWNILKQQMAVVQPYGPRAMFTITPETAHIGQSIEFDATASQQGSNGTNQMPINEYRWDFGDGYKATTTTPIAYHTYSGPGEAYSCTLTVFAKGAAPETDSLTKTVLVAQEIIGGHSVLTKTYNATPPSSLYFGLVIALSTLFTAIRRRRAAKKL